MRSIVPNSHPIDAATPHLALHTVQYRSLVGNRVAVSVAVGLAVGVVSWRATQQPGFLGQDFASWWLAARALLDGQNPYTSIVVNKSLPGFLYPLPAALLAVPFAWLPVSVAGPIFAALSCALLAFATTRRASWPLLGFLGAAMYLSVYAAQFSPLLTLGFIWPGAMWLGALKPNIGLAMLAYRPSVPGTAAMCVVALLSLVVSPTWPVAWLAALRSSSYHYAPILAPGGFLLLLAGFKWRRPEARLLLAMAILPTSPLVYETVPLLFTVPSNRREAMLLTLAGTVAYAIMLPLAGNTDALMDRGRWVILWCCYLPALVMVLRRRNVA